MSSHARELLRTQSQGCRGLGAEGGGHAPPPYILADQLILSEPGG